MSFLHKRTDKLNLPRRDEFRILYQSARWHRFSKKFLKENRLCAECLKRGITEVAEVTDHIEPLVIWVAHGGDPYDLKNLQPLSKRCHNIKTASENKGWNKR